MTKYCVSGDKTGVTYGIYERTSGKVIPDKIIRSGIKSLKEAMKLIEELEKVENRC